MLNGQTVNVFNYFFYSFSLLHILTIAHPSHLIR